MPRPTTKTELLNAASEQYAKLTELIHSRSSWEQEKEFTFDAENAKEAHWKRDKNIRDVLIHLYEWHQLLLAWADSNMGGDLKQFLPKGYSWKTYGDMNMEFWRMHQSTSFIDAKMLLEKTIKTLLSLLLISQPTIFLKKALSHGRAEARWGAIAYQRPQAATIGQ